MATVKIDELSKEDRALIVSALELMAARVFRACKAEKNDAIAELRSKEYSAIMDLSRRFS